MKSTAGTSPEASGGVTRDEQERRPEVWSRPALKGAHHEATKAVNRRKLMVLYPLWVVILLSLFGALILAEWLGTFSYKQNRWT